MGQHIMTPLSDRDMVRREVAGDLRRLANLLEEAGDRLPVNRDRTQVRYCVIDKDTATAREHFEAINAVLASFAADTADSRISSHEQHAEHYDDGVTHHTSTLHMGYGRVSYQVLWIDRSEEGGNEQS